MCSLLLQSQQKGSNFKSSNNLGYKIFICILILLEKNPQTKPETIIYAPHVTNCALIYYYFGSIP